MQMITDHNQSRGKQADAVKPVLDLLVINAADLAYREERIRVFRRIQNLANNTTRTGNRRGLWLLILTHSRLESEIAYRVTEAVTAWCQGVRVVTEIDSQMSARAALSFHQLHFPDISEQDRASRIAVFGSTRELALSRVSNHEEGV